MSITSCSLELFSILTAYSITVFEKKKWVWVAWCGDKWGVAVLCLDGIGRESERVELKGESLRKKCYLCLRYWRSTTDWTDMLRNWWTGIGRNMHVADCNPGKLNGYVPEYVGNHDAAEDAAVIYIYGLLQADTGRRTQMAELFLHTYPWLWRGLLTRLAGAPSA